MRTRPLNRRECVQRLAQVPIGRVGITIGALPAILPVNYRLHGDAVIFGAMTGSRLELATNGTIVAFQADAYDPDRRSGWTVMGVGRSLLVRDPEALGGPYQPIPEPWVRGEVAEQLMRIELAELSGYELGNTR